MLVSIAFRGAPNSWNLYTDWMNHSRVCELLRWQYVKGRHHREKEGFFQSVCQITLLTKCMCFLFSRIFPWVQFEENWERCCSKIHGRPKWILRNWLEENFDLVLSFLFFEWFFILCWCLSIKILFAFVCRFACGACGQQWWVSLSGRYVSGRAA